MGEVSGIVESAPAKDHSYFHERLDPLGWTEETNHVRLPAEVAGDRKEHLYPLFDADEQGNLVIPYYRVNGAKAEYRKEGDKHGRHYIALRYKVPIVRDGKTRKYKNPAGTGSLPWFPPAVIEAFNAGRHFETLVLTEGVLKAYAGTAAGAMVVGLAGIQNTKDKLTGTLHGDIIDLLKKCTPKNVVFLHDGDCRSLSRKWPEDPNVDLYTKPHDFFTSARNLGELLKDYARMIGFRMYYMHVVGESIPVTDKEEHPKGLDDLLLAYQEAKVRAAAYRIGLETELRMPSPERAAELRAEAVKEIAQDLTSFSAPPRFFERRDLDRPDKLRDYFHLRSADTFYAAHQERIGEKEFVYDGTKYQWNEADKELKVIVPSVSKRYVRVGTDYYKYVKIPNPHTDQLEEVLKQWKKATIVEDHNKYFLSHILKLEAFTCYPDHIAYQEIKDNCLNSYSRFSHKPDPEAEPPVATLAFLEHIFGSGTVTCPHPKEVDENGEPKKMVVKELDLGLDYMKLLYEKPTQMLPILCLVSKDRGTGKTTFFDYLGHVFGPNKTDIGAKDLEGDFNYHYASKKIIVIDEALIGKQESVEKLKVLSTAKNIMVNNKGVAQYPQPFFGAFLLGSNNIRSFIRTDDDEVRFWVRKVPKIPPSLMDTELATKLVNEIPAFLHYLSNRAFATEKLFRSWFDPGLLVTEALKDVRKHSTPGAKRSIEGWIRGIFWAKPDLDSILMTAEDIRKEVFPGRANIDDVYIRQVLREDLGVETYTNEEGKKVTRPYEYWRIVERKGNGMTSGPTTELERVKCNVSKRPFVFHRTAFISKEEQETVLHEPYVAENSSTLASIPAPAVPTHEGEDDLPF